MHVYYSGTSQTSKDSIAEVKTESEGCISYTYVLDTVS
jgi:hypothetical protein